MKYRYLDYVWVILDCPICQCKFSLSAIIDHRNKHHSGMSLRNLEGAIAKALKANSLAYKAHALGPPAKTVSATTVLRDKARYLDIRTNKAYEGGAWGLKKK